MNSISSSYPFMDDPMYMIRRFKGGHVIIEVTQNYLPTREEVMKLRGACEGFLSVFPTDAAVASENKRQKRLLKKRLRARGVKEKQPLQGFVYLAVNGRNGFSKIGFSKTPRFRENTLQSEEPDVSMVAHAKGTIADERCLHKKFAACRIRGEWFNLTNEQKEELIAHLSLEEKIQAACQP